MFNKSSRCNFNKDTKEPVLRYYLFQPACFYSNQFFQPITNLKV